MRARDLAEPIPTVTMTTTGAEAARIVAEHRLQGLVVVGADGLPHAVIPTRQILGFLIPSYVRDDPSLARAIDEETSDSLCARLTTTPISDLLAAAPPTQRRLPTVLPEDTVLEIASAMVEGDVSLVVVQEEDGTYVGVVLVSRLLAAIAVLAGEDSELVRLRLSRDLLDGLPPGPDTSAGEARS